MTDIMALTRKPCKINNYQTKYQFNQIMHRYFCDQKPTPTEILQEIADAVRGPISKASIYRACARVKKVKYQRRWVEVKCFMTKKSPPLIPPQVLLRMRQDFNLMQNAFPRLKDPPRKIFGAVTFFIREMLWKYGVVTPSGMLDSRFDDYFPYPKCKKTAEDYRRMFQLMDKYIS